MRNRAEETRALFLQVTLFHISAVSRVLSLRLSQQPAAGLCLCQIYPLQYFISCFFNIYFNIILSSTSVTPILSLRVFQLNFRTITQKCYIYYIKSLNTLCTTLCKISASYSGWYWIELIYWCESWLSWFQDFAALFSRLTLHNRCR